MSLFRIKICGVTRPIDAAVAVEAGADAIGLNFYSPSPRFLHDARAADVIEAIPQHVAKVGVFVNATAAEIRAKVQLLDLDFVQLHGDEPPKMVSELGSTPVIRALRVGLSDQKYLAALVPPSGHFAKLPAALLVDAHSPDLFGGTGQTLDWSSLAELRKQAAGLRLILAGGLTPDNVAEAIRVARPDGVDTASGVESSPGVKDHDKVRQFVEAARKAFASDTSA